jgi:hypothetical protein
MKTQITTESGTSYEIEVYHNDWEWCAVEENYDGPEDHYRSSGGKTKEDAIESLREQLSELERKQSKK